VRRRELVRHLNVLERVFSDATIVACPFGTVFASESEVRSGLLEARRQELLALLRRLSGRLQLNVRATYDEEVVLREIVGSSDEIATLSARTRSRGADAHYDRIALGERVAAALAARREHDAGRLLEPIASAADDVVVDPPDDVHVLKASFLVRSDRYATFDATLEELAVAEAPQLRFECIGPLPPTAFTALTEAD